MKNINYGVATTIGPCPVIPFPYPPTGSCLVICIDCTYPITDQNPPDQAWVPHSMTHPVLASLVSYAASIQAFTMTPTVYHQIQNDLPLMYNSLSPSQIYYRLQAYTWRQILFISPVSSIYLISLSHFQPLGPTCPCILSFPPILFDTLDLELRKESASPDPITKTQTIWEISQYNIFSLKLTSPVEIVEVSLPRRTTGHEM